MKTFFLLDGCRNREQVVVRLLLIQVTFHMQNLARHCGLIPEDRVLDRAKTLLARASEGDVGCRKVAVGLMGPFGPLPPAFKSQKLPEVARRRPRHRLRPVPAGAR